MLEGSDGVGFSDGLCQKEGARPTLRLRDWLLFLDTEDPKVRRGKGNVIFCYFNRAKFFVIEPLLLQSVWDTSFKDWSFSPL